MVGNDSWFRKCFRNAEALARGNATAVLSQLRANRPPAEYATLFGAFRAAAPKTFRSLCVTGPRNTSELVWAHRELAPLSLEDELQWATIWLSANATRLNAFRRCARQIQEHVVVGNTQAALSTLDEQIRLDGWSLWAVELRAALLQMSEGTAVQREWLAQLQSKTINSIPGLLFEVFGDRNDDTYSYDAVYGKCMTSFPRFESLAPWLVDYLKFRALAHIEEEITALPNILCRDITSSLVDYYEDVVEALAVIAGNDALASVRPGACKLISSLLKAGYQDHRLHKLGTALGLGPMPDTIELRPAEAFRVFYLGAFDRTQPSLPFGVASDLIQCQDEGSAAYELVGKLVKWGVNFRGLDIGSAVALAALCSTDHSSGVQALPINTLLVSEAFCVEEAAALSDELALEMLTLYFTQRGREVPAEQWLKPSRWNVEEEFPHGGPIYLWLARRLFDAGELDELDALLRRLEGKSPYWERQSAKLSILAALKRGWVKDALDALEIWYRRNYFYALEFPAEQLFKGRKWADFRTFDPITVGLVAHREFEARGDSNVSYICKMACRSFLSAGWRQNIVESFEAASHERKGQIVDFLRDVWIEQNLSLCHQYQTTAEVRTERMSVLQLLLNWESERATEYAEAIKDLTFEQTLQRGLERIDQTRVFANESAITRWAEKELEQDYERWRRLSESSSGGRTVDDMLRQYALDPMNVEVLKEFANGKPTAADALLIDLLDRLFKRFLLDPTDGLDTYLSLRIRHGSLRGTILGPLEEQGLLYSSSGFSEEAFAARWDDVLRLPFYEKAGLVTLMRDFSRDIRREVDEFVEKRVQVQRTEKPEGAFQQVLSPLSAKLIAVSLAERPPTFYAFLSNAYFVFWKLVESGLSSLRSYVDDVLATALHSRVEQLMQELRALGHRYLPLVTTLTTASTMTKSQCDSVAEWFQLPSMVGGEKYQLPDAIEIAAAATRNVHRASSTSVQLFCLPATRLPLTTSGLAVLMDCLFVIFENAWKHSGLAESLPPVEVYSEYEPTHRLLTLKCRNALSSERMRELLEGGELSHLRTKYLGELPLELIPREGGSGFPKLARLARAVPREVCPLPFDFGIEDELWYSALTVPLYDREGAFEAYE